MTGRRATRDRDRRGGDLRRLPPPARGALSRRVRGCLCGASRRRRTHRRVRRRQQTHRGRRRQRRRQSRGDRAIAARDAGIKLAAQLLVYPVTDIAGNFADQGERALSLARRECRRLFPDPRGDGVVLRPLPRRHQPTATTGGPRRCARKISPGLRRRSSPPPGSIRCATRARPMRMRCIAAGVADQISSRRGAHSRLFRPRRCLRHRPREAQRARADFRAMLEAGG